MLGRGEWRGGAGRAIWREAIELTGDKQCEFLTTTGAARMRQTTDVVDATARPWTEWCPATDTPEG